MKASAPAKLFIIGEYAVLEGAPAAVAALLAGCATELHFVIGKPGH